MLEIIVGSATSLAAGLIGVVLGFWLQRSTSKREELDRSLQNVITELDEYIGVTQRSNGLSKRAKKVQGHRVSTAMSLVWFYMRGKNTSAGFLISEIWHEARAITGAEPTMDLALELKGAIITWRARNRRSVARKNDSEPLKVVYWQLQEYARTHGRADGLDPL